jgi:eukaryotic-like serine/threonine-protein kinase
VPQVAGEIDRRHAATAKLALDRVLRAKGSLEVVPQIRRRQGDAVRGKRAPKYGWRGPAASDSRIRCGLCRCVYSTCLPPGTGVTQQTDRLNTALAGRYRIERHLGEGGMASVYLCADLKHKRNVALKLLKPELAAVLGAERFVQEITTTASLQHPHILPLFDSGSADGFLYYVMPYVEGETLRAKLDRETQLSVDEAVRIAREVLDALDYAHQHGIVHRDVKPENILLHGGHAMVADFGIALALSAAAGGRMTETGLSLGTPHYMSPEQATGEKEITARSDVYSLGSVLYEMLTGEPPHTGGSAQQIIMRIITNTPRPVSEIRKSVPANVAAAVAKALEKLPADRFESAKAFSEALANPAYTNASAALTGAIAGRGRASAQPFKRRFIGMSLLAAAAIATTLWGWLKPAQTVVSRYRTVLWDTPHIRPGIVGRGLAISPDGGTVVFEDSTASGWQLFAHERNRLDVTAVGGTADVLAYAGAPAFSPDGAWIAFVARDGKVKKVPRGGGAAVVIADSANVILIPSLAWLDGGTILYVDAGFGVRAVSQDGGTPRQVFKGFLTDTAGRGIASVAGLPGGGSALLTVCTLGCDKADLRVLDLRSLKSTALVPDVLAGWPLPGGAVAFVRKDGGVLAAPFDPRALRFTRPPVPVLDGVRTFVYDADIAVSANGTLIYVAGGATTTAPRYQPVWVTRTGVATPVDTGWSVPLLGGCTCDGALALSPDGRRLALSVSREKSADGDIYVKQLDAVPFALTPLTFTNDGLSPVWTSDGRSVVYSEGKGNDQITSLLQRRADGTGAVDTLIPARARSIIEVVPTRDTTQFILGVGRGIVLAHRGDTATTPLMAHPGFAEINPALSPDGRWLAYASNETGRFEVYVRPFPAVNARRVQVSQAGGTEPRWAHSGRELFFRNGAHALVAAAVLPAATFSLGGQTVLFDGSPFYFAGTELARSYDVAPGDQRFVFMRTVVPTGPSGPAAAPDKLVEVTNWATEVQTKLAGRGPR